jgi:hypothetical protein
MKNLIIIFACALLFSCATTKYDTAPIVAVPGHPTPKEQKELLKYNKKHKPLSDQLIQRNKVGR